MEHRSRLYLITPPQIADVSGYSADFERALDAGDIACVQLRLKNTNGDAAPDDDVLRTAEALLPICQKHDAAFLINDRPDLATKVGADGVHIGQDDAPYAKARAALGDGATVGVTCHNSKHLGLVAGEAGADYVAFGAFFPTKTKEAPTSAEPALLEWWAFATTVPCVAIGGITPGNCRPLVRAGADFLAVASAVWEHPEGPEAAVKAFEKAIREA